MIDSLYGSLGQIAADRISLRLGSEQSHLEISVLMARSQIADLPQPPAAIQLATCLIWRDTGPQLFGFSSRSQVQLFQQLNDVAGVGPKTSLALIDQLGEEGLACAIESEDFNRLAKVAGVGKKTAQRIVIDLKGKCGQFTPSLALAPSVEQQACNGLVHLGYPPGQAAKLVQAALVQAPEESASEIIAKALRLGAR